MPNADSERRANPVYNPTVEEVLQYARMQLNDGETPQLWSDDEICEYYNKTMADVARMTDMWIESLSYGYVTRTDIIFAIDKTITTIAGNFIQAGFYRGASITISGSPANSGIKTIAKVSTGVITVEESLTAEVAGASITISYPTPMNRIVLVHGTSRYQLDPRVVSIKEGTVWITDADGNRWRLEMTTRSMLDSCFGDWRDEDEAPTSHYLLDDQEGYITMFPTPDDVSTYTLTCTVGRMPMEMAYADDRSKIVELRREFLVDIMDGIREHAYAKDDVGTMDLQRSVAFGKKFRSTGIDNMILAMSRFRRSQLGVLTPHRGNL